MIVSCAPFRVSFAGGGSDIASFFTKSRGAVLSCTIAKYSFAIIHPFFNASKYHLKYARTELTDSVDDIQHPLLREALRMQQIPSGIEITSVADIPSGTGLGSSSSFAVALLNALYASRGVFASKSVLAEAACTLEIDHLGEPIGKQDQYAAAFGGINLIEFEPQGGVLVQPLPVSNAIKAELESNLLLYFTGTQREARSLLSQQVTAMQRDAQTFATIQRMAELAYEMRDILLAGDLDRFGLALHRGWEMKRGLSSQISNSIVDEYYTRARGAGALGGKLTGAGGGGFMVLYCPRSAQKRVREAMQGLQNLDFRFDWAGARIAFAD
jgi:D-glycero-alpha-D-manno-heptose-7-phosphate kinase